MFFCPPETAVPSLSPSKEGASLKSDFHPPKRRCRRRARRAFHPRLGRPVSHASTFEFTVSAPSARPLQPLLLHLVLALWWGWLGAAPSLAAPGVPLKVGVDRDYPPFSSLAASGAVTGFDADIIREIGLLLGRPCQIVALPADHLLEEMKAGRLDLIAHVQSNEERLRLMDFSAPYFRSRFAYVGKSGVPPSFEGKRIGVRAASLDAAFVRKEWGERAAITALPLTELLKRMREGDLDLLFVNGLAAYDFLTSDEGRAFDIVGHAPLSQDLPGELRFGVRKGDAALREQVDQALAALRFNGVYARINRRYFPHSLY